MITKRCLLRIAIGFLSLCLVLTICGCIGDFVSIPIKVEDSPNTFRHGLRGLGEKILRVDVLKSEQSYSPSTLVWRIEAKCEVSAFGFTVTAGQIPKGFEQTFPHPPEKFSLVRGQEYAIVIHTNLTSVHAIGIYWKAE